MRAQKIFCRRQYLLAGLQSSVSIKSFRESQNLSKTPQAYWEYYNPPQLTEMLTSLLGSNLGEEDFGACGTVVEDPAVFDYVDI